MKYTSPIQIQTYRIMALWAFVECSLGGLAHAFQLPFTGIYVGGGSIFCIVLLARFAGTQHILPALATVLSLKFALNPHSPIGAYLAVTFQGLVGYVLFRFSNFFAFNTILLGFLGLLESALQKILVLTLLYGKGLYEVLDKIIAETAKVFGFLNYPHSTHLFGLYVCLYAFSGIWIGIFVNHYIKRMENFQNNELYFQCIEDATLQKNAPIKYPKKSYKLWKTIATLVFILVFLYIWEVRSLWFNFVLSVLMIFLWYRGFMKITVWLSKKYRWDKWANLKTQQDILASLPAIKMYWVQSYHISKTKPLTKRFFFFVDLFIRQILFRLESLPQSSKQDV
jgi:hypothetical protein